MMRQHLTCVQAAAQLSGAEVEGDRLGSTELLFQPQTSMLFGDAKDSLGKVVASIKGL